MQRSAEPGDAIGLRARGERPAATWMRGALALAGLALLPGCGTINSVASGCFGPWSGVRQDRELLSFYTQERHEEREGGSAVPLGFDAALAAFWDRLFVASDLPLSALLDTAVVPIALATGQDEPQPAGLGCGWTQPHDGAPEWRPPGTDR
jgi:uncharacterized protein YceK